MEDPTRPTERIPPGQPHTPPTQPVPPPTQPVPPPQRTAVASTTETALRYDDSALWEELRRIRFWSYFGSAVSALAAILAGIALIVALDARNQDDSESTRPVLQGLRRDVSDLRSDVSEARAASTDVANQADRLSARVRRLEAASSEQADVTEQLDQLQQDITDLNERIDQVEQAQEEAAAGGP